MVDVPAVFKINDVTEKIGIIVGMSLFGVIDQITGSMRNAILFFMLFFVVGVLMLFRVPRKNLN